MKRKRLLALALVFSCLAAPLTANSSLVRLTDRVDLLPWEAVGRIDMAGGAYCTGVLIASDLVLTAAHCIFDRQAQLRPAGSLTFRAGLADGTALAESKVARAIAHQEYDPTLRFSAATIRYDVALLELATPISTSVADPFVVHQGAGKGRSVSVVSYGRGRDEALSWQRDCSVLGRGEGLIVFNCNVTYGSSGAPVFLRENGKIRILTLISGGAVNDGPPRAYGMELPALVDRLKRDLRARPLAQVAPGEIRRIKVGDGGTASGAKFAKP